VADYTLDFGDGSANTTNAGGNPSDTIFHTYTEFGKFYPIIYLRNGKQGNLACDFAFISKTYIITDTVFADFSLSDSTGCMPLTVLLADSSLRANAYVWDFGDLSPNFTGANPISHNYSLPGKYTLSLIVTSIRGCTDTLLKPLEVFPLPVVDAKGDTLICFDETTQLTATQNVFYRYQWTPSQGLSNDTIYNPMATPDTTVYYFVTVTDTNGCKNTSASPINVKVQRYLLLDAYPDTAIIVGEKVILNLNSNEGVVNYQWSPSDGLSCITCPNPVANPLVTTTYTVTVKDLNGCFENKATVVVIILDKFTVNVPEAFTPNGDGKNDIIYVRGWGIAELLEFKIFNRWGELVFISNDINKGWDGIYRGNPQNMDSYVYYVRAKSFYGVEAERKGSFTLIR